MQRMVEMDISIIEQKEDGSKDFSNVQRADVVILPAFGASVQELTALKELEVQIVDTTCPWVSKVLSPCMCFLTSNVFLVHSSVLSDSF